METVINPVQPTRSWHRLVGTRLRRGVIVGIAALTLATGGLFGLGSLGSAEAASCPTYAAKWVHKDCLSGVYTVAYKTDRYSEAWYRVSLRVGTFRGATYAYAWYTNSKSYYDLDQDAGVQRVQIDGNSFGYDHGSQTVSIRSKYSRDTAALRSSPRSDVKFRACTWWWSRVTNSVSNKYCTTYW